MAAAIRADVRSRTAILRSRIDRVTQRFLRVLPWRIRTRLARLLRPAPQVDVHGESIRVRGSRRAVVVTSDLSGSGAPRLIHDLALWLRRRGDEVIVLSPEDGIFREALVRNGIAVVIGPAVRDRRAPLFRRLAAMADVGLCNTVVSSPAVAALAPGVPIIWFIHEISLLEQLLHQDRGLAATLALPARLWAGSELPAAVLRPYRPDVEVVPYGLEPIGTGAPPGSRPGRRLRFGVFGTYEARKGQDLAVAAMSLLSSSERESIQLVMHGRTLLPDFIDALRRAAAADPTIMIGEALDHPAVDEAMLDCDAVLMPSRDDTLPMVTADALGCGRVLVCTRTTGTAAYLTHGVNGFVAEEPTAASIAAALSEALARRADWPAIGRAGQVLFDEVFSVSAYQSRLERTFASIGPKRPDR